LSEGVRDHSLRGKGDQQRNKIGDGIEGTPSYSNEDLLGGKRARRQLFSRRVHKRVGTKNQNNPWLGLM